MVKKKINLYQFGNRITLLLFSFSPKVIQSSEEGATVDQLLDLKDWGKKLVAVVETNKGTIELELFAKETFNQIF